MPRPPFNMLRACFLLLAMVVGTQVLITFLGGLVCFWLFATSQLPIGGCQGFSAVVRETWTEVLATVLALLLAAGGAPPRPPPGDQDPGGGN